VQLSAVDKRLRLVDEGRVSRSKQTARGGNRVADSCAG
jgi:hypothetical protein